MSFILGERSLKRLEGVHEDLVRVVKRAILVSDIDFGVVEGLRTKKKQEEYFKNGKSLTMNSAHLKGFAVDLAPSLGSDFDWQNEPAFFKIAEAMRLAALHERVLITWGRGWLNPLNAYNTPKDAQDEYVASKRKLGKSPFLDGPHFEISNWRKM